jgi:hypothetical protein
MTTAQYTSIRDQVYSLTNKSNLVTETDIAIRQAVRMAHRLGKFWRDLVTVPLSGLTVQALQTLDLSVYADFRQLAILQSPMLDKPLDPVTILDLTDPDGYFRPDVCYAIGTTLNIRARTPSDSYTLTYWKLPIVGDVTLLNDWIAAQHEDYVVLQASANIFAMIGEQEIKTRIESLAAQAKTDILSDNAEFVGR